MSSDNNHNNEALVAAARVPRDMLRQWWQGLARRERRLIAAAAAIVTIALLWWVVLAPPLRTLQRAPAQIDAAETQLQVMQRLAAEARELRGVTPVPADQAGNVLKAATARLGDKARLAVQGDRAVLTVAGVGSVALRDWLAEARSGARARTIEANLSRGTTGLTGTVVVGMGGGFVKRWLVFGTSVGALVALIVFAPAAWLAGMVSSLSAGYFMLSDARGSVWSGSAVLVLTGGEGSRDASALPGRLHWNVGLDGLAVAVRLRQACCISGEQRLRVVPGLGRMRVELLPSGSGGPLGQWPAAWLSGLGTPWNTLQLSGALQFSTPGIVLESASGRWTFSGRADLELHSLASRISTLDMLGTYRLTLAGDGAQREGTSVLLTTTTGALQLTGNGQFAAGRLRFRGQASAAPGSEAALNNLLNIIGRRQGAHAVISIG